MTDVAVAALAARTGTAVVSLMRAENWPEFQTDLARWFGGADQRQAERIAERLGKERDEWLVAMPSTKYALRARFREAWATRVSDRLDDLDGAARATAVRELQALLDGLLPPEPEAAPEAPAPEAAPVHAQNDALAVGGDLSVTASGERSFAAAVIRGDVHAGAPPSPVPPPVPDASQG
jgi:hypothetical protein